MMIINLMQSLKKNQLTRNKGSFYNNYINKEKFATPSLPSIGKISKNLEEANPYNAKSAYKDILPQNKRSYSITNMKKVNSYQQDILSPSVIPDKYFRNINKVKMMDKIRVPKTGNSNKSMDAQENNNFLRNKLIKNEINFKK